MSVLRCKCCEGVELLTPEPIANRPGLGTLRYRAGTHSTFLESMKARLSSLVLEIGAGEGVPPGHLRPLDRLRARQGDDASIALLDAWACIADVLTFYQERIANEGYLRTATERRSILELARLIGYVPRPGVAASVHLAFTLEKGYQIKIPAGTRAQSVPAPGETMESFETSEDFDARFEWGNLQQRLGRPQVFDAQGAREVSVIYLKGTSTGLQKGDPLLLVVGESANDRVLRFVDDLEPQNDDERTRIILRPTGEVVPDALAAKTKHALAQWIASAPAGVNAASLVAQLKRWQSDLSLPLPARSAYDATLEELRSDFLDLQKEASSSGWVNVEAWVSAVIEGLAELSDYLESGPSDDVKPDALTELLMPLALQPSIVPLASKDVTKIFTRSGEGIVRSLTLFRPSLAEGIYAAWKNLAPAPSKLKVYALRVKASPFGYNAAKQPDYRKLARGDPEVTGLVAAKMWDWKDEWPRDGEDSKTLFLETAYENISNRGYVAVLNGNETAVIGVNDVRTVSRTAYGISAKTSRLSLDSKWFKEDDDENDISFIRSTMVYAGSEQLETADAPLVDDIAGAEIELADLFDGLEPGRPVVVSGERTFSGLVEGGSGVRGSELAIVAGVRQGVAPLDPYEPGSPDLPGDRVHTTLLLTHPLTYTYKRATAVIYGNVTQATHGESRSELIGSGEAIQAFQEFALKQYPITHVSSSSPTGETSSLAVRVNEVLWHPSEGFPGLATSDRSYVERQDDEQKTIVTFGDGKTGLRLPTGFNNVVGTLRIGIGKPGNVAANAISLLASKPLGVREVINPLPATGGADRDDRDQARASILTSRLALGRLVSVSDYEAFSTTFAGIAKASASRLPVGRRFVVYVTIAGADDIPIDPTSDLYSNLSKALRAWGDPHQTIQISIRELVIPIISANVRIDPDREWISVEKEIRSAIQTEFGFRRRAIGQSLAASEILGVMHSVPGVIYVDIDVFKGLTETLAISELARSESKTEDQPPSPAPIPASVEPAVGLRALSVTDRQSLAQSFIEARPPRLDEDGAILPGQIAYVRSDLPSAIALKEIS